MLSGLRGVSDGECGEAFRKAKVRKGREPVSLSWTLSSLRSSSKKLIPEKLVLWDDVLSSSLLSCQYDPSCLSRDSGFSIKTVA